MGRTAEAIRSFADDESRAQGTAEGADFRAVAERADEQRRAAEDAFVLSGGERVLGVAAG